MRPIWTRLKRETSKAYESFEIYRDMGTKRSIEKVGERLGKNPIALARLSKKYEWVKRTNEYDAYIGQREGDARMEANIKMDQRHADLARTYQEVAYKMLETFEKLMLDGKYDMHDMVFSKYVVQSLKIFKEAVAIERVSLGADRNKTVPVPATIKDPQAFTSIGKLTDNNIDKPIKGGQNARSEGGTVVEEKKEQKKCFKSGSKLKRRTRCTISE